LNELSEFLREIYDKNDGKFAAFNRFVDVSVLNEEKLDLDTVILSELQALQNHISMPKKFVSSAFNHRRSIAKE